MSKREKQRARGVLRRARSLVRKGWTQGAFARGEDGVSCMYESERAVCFCAVGALRAAGETGAGFFFEESRIPAYAALSEAAGVPLYSVSRWNDEPGRMKSDVLSAFDRAIVSLA